MAIELHHLHPGHDDELSRLKARIAELEKENGELRSKNEGLLYALADAETDLAMSQRWRKFPDEKPKWGEEVIVVDDANKQYIVRFSYDMKWISWGNMNTCESKYVKYWLPLPSAPKEEK